MTVQPSKDHESEFAGLDNTATLLWLDHRIESTDQCNNKKLVHLLETVKTEVIFELEGEVLRNLSITKALTENRDRSSKKES